MLLYTLSTFLILTSLTLSKPLEKRQADCPPVSTTVIDPSSGSTMVGLLPCPPPTPTPIITAVPSPTPTPECSPIPTTVVDPVNGNVMEGFVPCPAPAATEPATPMDGTSPPTTTTATALDPDGTISCWFEPWLCNTNIPAPTEEAAPPPPLDGVPPVGPTPNDSTPTDIAPTDTTPTSYAPIATVPDPNLVAPGPVATQSNIYCGGIAGLPCPDAMFCSADPSAPVDCVDCSGICVPINTK